MKIENKMKLNINTDTCDELYQSLLDTIKQYHNNTRSFNLVEFIFASTFFIVRVCENTAEEVSENKKIANERLEQAIHLAKDLLEDHYKDKKTTGEKNELDR